MRWDNLFDDLEAQLQRQASAEATDLEMEEERLRLGRLGMRDRLVALHAAGTSGTRLALTLANGDRILMTPDSFGRDWVAGVFRDQGGHCIVPLAAIAGVALTDDQARVTRGVTAPTSPLADRLGLPYVLRDLCRRRQAVELVLSSGAVYGTIDRVGLDHVDVALHEPGAPRRSTAVREYRLVPLAGLVLVRF